MFNFLSIHKKLVLVLTFFILIIAASAYFFSKEIYNIVIENLANKYTKASVLYQKERIKGIIDKELTLSKHMSNSSIFRLWAKDEKNPIYKNIALEEFENYRRTFVSRSAFFVINRSLNYYYADEDTLGVPKIIKTVSKDKPEDVWYFITLENPNNYTLNVDYDKEVGKTNLWINVVMREKGLPLGIIGTGIDISDFIREFIEKTDRGITSFILEEDGAIFASKDKTHLNLRIVDKRQKQKTIYELTKSSDIDAVKSAIEGVLRSPDEVNIFRVNFENTQYMAAVSFIPELKWVILSAIDIQRVFDIRELTLPIVIVFLIIVIIFLIFGLLIQKMVIIPIKNLGTATEKIKEGDYNITIDYRKNDEIGVLGNAFSHMAEKIKEHINTLEDRVSERTKELSISREKISLLLESSEEGFLKFDKGFKVDSEYSKICETIFGVNISGMNIIELLYRDNKSKQNNIKSILNSIFNQDNLFLKETMVDLLPNEVEISGRFYHLRYKLNNDNTMTLIMKDITEERKLTNQLEYERKKLSFVVEFIRDEFIIKRLVEDFKEFIENIGGYDSKVIKRELHTYKGNFLQKGFINLPKTIHEAEERVETLFRDSESKKKLFQSLSQDLDILKDYLGSDFVEGYFIRVEEQKLKNIADTLRKIDKSFYEDIMALLKTRLSDYLENFRQLVQRVAEREDKKVNLIINCPDNISLYLPDYLRLLRSFYHIITNAVIHGIEPPSVRDAKGKPEEGTIIIEAHRVDGTLNISFRDDGRGIEPEAFEKIFSDDYTTKIDIDEYSGRGSGLSAVKMEVERFAGKINIESERGEWTVINITIPFEE
ncbi:MAG: ATP-binding protein [Thermodesulfovibrionales bacterium]|nr:ATP-binding protein [Thermodesulfovibrionales bacterium]